jgi:hypothetical protein
VKLIADVNDTLNGGDGGQHSDYSQRQGDCHCPPLTHDQACRKQHHSLNPRQNPYLTIDI